MSVLSWKSTMIYFIFSLLSIILASASAHAKRDQYIKDSDFVNTGFFSDYSGLMEDESFYSFLMGYI